MYATKVTSGLAVRRALAAEMAAQHGLVTFDRALSLGATSRMIEFAVRTGEWVAPHARVYRSAAAPCTAEQDLLAAALAAGPGAVASHRSAAWLWGLLALPPEEPEVTVPYARSPRPGGILLHRSTDLLGAPVHVRRSIPVTDPCRTVLDAAGVLGLGMAELVVDRAIATRAATLAGITAALERYARRGRRGAGRLREILETRGISASGRPPSVLESRMARIARMIDAPPPVPEYEVAGGLYRLDFAWPEAKVAVEVDGWAFHADHATWKRGLARDRWCLVNEWAAPHFTWDDVCDHPEAIADEVGRLLAARSARARTRGPEL